MRRSSRRTNKRKAENMAAVHDEELFWDVGNFKKTVKRIDDGAVICDDILRMVHERAEIEAKYAKKLTVWEDKWRKQVENGPMYATMKEAFSGVLSEAQERAKIQMDCFTRLHNQVIESVKRWKNQSYHKHFLGHWKETKEVDDEFARAQKPWAEGFNKVQRAKRNYHSACKSFDAASHTHSMATKDENFAPEKVKKLEDTVSKHEGNVSRTKNKYQEKLKRLEPLSTAYEGEMIKVFEKCQKMEEKKLHFFQDMLVEYHKSINISEDARLAGIFRNQNEIARSADVNSDLSWWAENHGADMPRRWPKFEAYVYGGQNSSFSVATLHMSVLDAKLKDFSEEDLQAITKVTSPELNSRGTFGSSQVDLLTPLDKEYASKPNESYAAYSNFYKNNKRLDHIAQDMERVALVDSDSSDSIVGFESYNAAGPDDSVVENTSDLMQDIVIPSGHVISASAVTQSEVGRRLMTGNVEEEVYLEPGEAASSTISDKNSVPTSPVEAEPQYQIPKRQGSNPEPYASYNGNENPFVNDAAGSRSEDEWDDPPPIEEEGMGVPVRALYTYNAVEDDELSFKSGDVFAKLSEEDAQGWCRGRINGKTGLYPANYVESV